MRVEVLVCIKDKIRGRYLGRHMDHLADSIAKLSQGRENGYIGREDIPVDDSSGEKCVPVISCRFTFSPIICFRLLPFCRKDLPSNDVTGYLDLSFDRAIDFPIYLMKFVDQNAQIECKLLVIIKHNAIYLFSAIYIFLMH